VTTEIGEVPIRVPRDRNGTFDPKLVPHGTRRLDGLEAQVISLCASGLTTGESQGHPEEICGTTISKDTVSRITDAVVADLEAWQSRPLDAMYAAVLVDAVRRANQTLPCPYDLEEDWATFCAIVVGATCRSFQRLGCGAGSGKELPAVGKEIPAPPDRR